MHKPRSSLIPLQAFRVAAPGIISGIRASRNAGKLDQTLSFVNLSHHANQVSIKAANNHYFTSTSEKLFSEFGYSHNIIKELITPCCNGNETSHEKYFILFIV